jgi:hypothetical protein
MSGDCGSDNEDGIAILAYIGSSMLAFGLIYQNYKMWRKKHTRAISMKWSLNYVVGLAFSNTFTAINGIIPILVGGLIEQFGLIILIGYKIYLEKKFFCINWGKASDIIEVSLNDFKQVADHNTITLSLDHEKLDDISELGNSDDDIFCITFTRQQLIDMLTKMDTNNDVMSHEKMLELQRQHHKSGINNSDDVTLKSVSSNI